MFKRGGVMAITDNLRMMVKVCRLYYEENLSQKEISALMGISRPQISRMLTCAPVAKHRHDQDQQPLRGRDQPGPRAGRALPAEGRPRARHPGRQPRDLRADGGGVPRRVHRRRGVRRRHERADDQPRGLVDRQARATRARVRPPRGRHWVGKRQLARQRHAQRLAECSGGSCYILNAPSSCRAGSRGICS